MGRKPSCKFSERTQQNIRERYNFTCSVCLQPVVLGHCAHLFQQAAKGQENVDEAISLGILPEKPYDRRDVNNGTLQCPTCHLEYFTKGILVWSPPLEILEWIYKKLVGKKEKHEMQAIFNQLSSKEVFPHDFRHLFSLFSLIPIFLPRLPNERYDLFVGSPPISILVHGEFRQDIRPRTGQDTFRIFRYREAHARRVIAPNALEASVVAFLPTPDQGTAPKSYWDLPDVSCNVILYLFLLEAKKVEDEDVTELTRPEIRMGKRIYCYLKDVEDNLARRAAKVAAKVGGGSKNLPGPSRLLSEERQQGNGRPHAHHSHSEPEAPRPCLTPPRNRAQSEPLSEAKVARMARCRLHQALGNNKMYCSICEVPIERKTLDRIKIESGIDIPTSTLRPSSSRGRGKSNESAETTVTSEDSVRSVSGEETETPANGDDPFVVDKTDYNPPHCATIHLRDAATIEVLEDPGTECLEYLHQLFDSSW